MRPDRIGRVTPNTVDLKIVLLGSAFVGKTSIINRYCNSVFNAEALPTVGAGFFTHALQVDNTDVTIMLWDTAGEERFRSVTPSLLRGAHALVLAFDLTDVASFSDIDIYLDLFLDTSQLDPNQGPPVLLLGNKADLPDRTIGQDMIDKWKAKNRIALYYPVSAKTGENIEAAMKELVRFVLSPELRPVVTPIEIVLTDRTQGSGLSCCRR
jgi:small GTP-binding protein